MAETAAKGEGRRAERRTCVKFAWFRRIDETTDEPSGAEEGIARSCDISETGVGLIVPAALPAGARVFVEIVTTAGYLNFIGRVMHCRERDEGCFRVGIHMEIVPPTNRATLMKVLTS
jgi:hypothetical protein